MTNPHNAPLATPTGQHIQNLANQPLRVMLMMVLSDCGLPAVGALYDLPVDLSNRYKRLAGYLVKKVMISHGYTQVPGRRSRISGSSVFKKGACYVQIGPAR